MKVEIQMEFLISIKPIFDEFLTKFQKEEPMIHLLYPNCEKLLKLTIGRLMKNKVYKDKRGEDLKKINVEKVEMQLKEREKKISVDIDNAMDCIKEARNLIKEGRMRDNMVSVESGEKGLDLGIEKETAGREKLKEVSAERQKIEKILLELKQFKKQRISAK